jgi:hypothetical protein
MSCLAGLRGPTLAILTPIPPPACFLSDHSVPGGSQRGGPNLGGGTA